jgi:ketosteroid isomerase-like protein
VCVDLPDVFEQHELGDDVAVVRRGGVGDRAFLFEAPRHSVQRVVGERVGVEAPLALEVADQPAPDVNVTLAARVESAIEPREQPIEGAAGRNPVTFEIGRDARTPWQPDCRSLRNPILRAAAAGGATMRSAALTDRPVTEPSHDLIRRYYQLYNERRLEESAALFAPDAVLEHAPYGGPPARGGAGYVASAERSFVAFPDAHIDVLGIRSHGESMYDVDLVATGTHQGLLDLGGYGRFEATGVHVRVAHREVIEIRDGRIAYASVTLDVDSLLAQLNGRSR